MKEKTTVADIDRSVYDIKDKETDAFRLEQGLTAQIVSQISDEKNDPVWMREFRQRSLAIYQKMPLPDWGPSLEGLDIDHIATYVRPNTKMQNDWKNVPQDMSVSAFRRRSANPWRASARSTIRSLCITMFTKRLRRRASSIRTWKAQCTANTPR